MSHLEDQVLEARCNAEAMEKLIRKMDYFILHSVFRVIHRFTTIHDEEYSIALEAFVEAVHSFDPPKGSFIPFAYLVIRRRLIDFLRTNRYRDQEIAVDPVILSGERSDHGETESFPTMIHPPTVTEDHTLRWEIIALKESLSHLGICFSDLAACSPKAEKTRKACARAVVFILRDQHLLLEVRRQDTLPLKILERSLQIPRKTLEAHRKYIIAAIEIMTGDYPLLSEYLGPIKEELAR